MPSPPCPCCNPQRVRVSPSVTYYSDRFYVNTVSPSSPPPPSSSLPPSPPPSLKASPLPLLDRSLIISHVEASHGGVLAVLAATYTIDIPYMQTELPRLFSPLASDVLLPSQLPRSAETEPGACVDSGVDDDDRPLPASSNVPTLVLHGSSELKSRTTTTLSLTPLSVGSRVLHLATHQQGLVTSSNPLTNTYTIPNTPPLPRSSLLSLSHPDTQTITRAYQYTLVGENIPGVKKPRWWEFGLRQTSSSLYLTFVRTSAALPVVAGGVLGEGGEEDAADEGNFFDDG